MKHYCVVYKVDGIHYRFRCYAKNKTQAKKECRLAMNLNATDIIDVYEE